MPHKVGDVGCDFVNTTRIDRECGCTAGELQLESFLGIDNVGKFDPVHKPKHYNSHPSGVECVTVIQHMPYNIGAAMKYLWRADEKHEVPIEDYKKAIQYIEFEIRRRQGLPPR